MALAELPIVYTASKHSVQYIGAASSFEDAYAVLRAFCKKNGVKFYPKYLKCLSSSVQIIVGGKVSALFPCFLYRPTPTKDQVIEKPKTKIKTTIKSKITKTKKVKA